MHPTSAENMERCIRWYLNDSGRPLRIADLGSQSVNGSYRSLFHAEVDYVGFDLEPGPGVDVVLESPYQIPAEEAAFDLVISGQMLEHCPHFWLLASEIHRVLKPAGLAFLIAPSAGPIHRYPVDCYRFYPDAWHALADWAGLKLIHHWLDERGPWRDLVGVFGKDAEIEPVTSPPARPRMTQSSQPDLTCAEMIGDMIAQRAPKLCVEIGPVGLDLLSLPDTTCVLIESSAEPTDRATQGRAFDCSAEDFFFFLTDEILTTDIDLAVIDGRRTAARILRDFMELERRMSTKGVIIITRQDPTLEDQSAARIASLLGSERPDLALSDSNTHRCGLLTIESLQPSSDVLWERYNPLMRRLLQDQPVRTAASQPQTPHQSGV